MMADPAATPPPTPVYAAACDTYYDAGWRGCLPLPVRRKANPPEGYTGNTGTFPSYADITSWAEERPDGNICLRLPETVLGVDVDAYKGKVGAASLVDAEARWGRLPATWRTTARDDGVSGIRLYRIPPGLAWPNEVGPGIEVIRFAHRYAVVWPSVHPDTGGTYRWVNPDGHPVIGQVPHPDELPLLPAAWVTGLTNNAAAVDRERADLDGTAVTAWLDALPGQHPCRAVTRALEQRLVDLARGAGSRHDTVIEATARLVHLGAEGHRGVDVALGQLHAAFTAAVIGDRSRDARSADAEWYRQLDGAVQLAATQPVATTDPCDNPLHGLIEQAPPSPAQLLATTTAATREAVPCPDRATTPPTPTPTSATAAPRSATPAGSSDPTRFSASSATPSSSAPTAPTQPTPASSTPSDSPPPTSSLSSTGTSTATPTEAPASSTEPEAPAPSWRPLDLTTYLDGTHTPATPTMLLRTDGVALIYPGLVHDFHGESESGKSLVAQALVAQLLTAGEDALYVDFESGPAQVVDRLLRLGAPPDAIAQRLAYVHPEVSPYALTEVDAWAGLLAGTYALAVLDGVTDALGQFGAGSKENDEIATWHRMVPRMLTTRTGAAVILVDHVSKDTDSRGRYALGGQAKMNAIDGASYVVEIDEPIGKGMRGAVLLRVAKDREGEVRPPCGVWRAGDRTQEAARVVVDSTGGDGTIRVTVDPPATKVGDVDQADAGPRRLTGILERLSRVLERQGEPMGVNAIVEAYKADGGTGRRTTVLDSINTLVAEGYVRDDPHGQQRRLQSVRVYRQRTDPASDKYAPELAGLIEDGHETVTIVGGVVAGHSETSTGSTGSHRFPPVPGTSQQAGEPVPAVRVGDGVAPLPGTGTARHAEPSRTPQPVPRSNGHSSRVKFDVAAGVWVDKATGDIVDGPAS